MTYVYNGKKPGTEKGRRATYEDIMSLVNCDHDYRHARTKIVRTAARHPDESWRTEFCIKCGVLRTLVTDISKQPRKAERNNPYQ